MLLAHVIRRIHLHIGSPPRLFSNKSDFLNPNNTCDLLVNNNVYFCANTSVFSVAEKFHDFPENFQGFSANCQVFLELILRALPSPLEPKSAENSRSFTMPNYVSSTWNLPAARCGIFTPLVSWSPFASALRFPTFCREHIGENATQVLDYK